MRIAVVGCGHMGGFLAEKMALKYSVAGFDIRRERVDKLKNVMALEEIEALNEFNPDILINAVPIDKTIEIFNELIPLTSGDCILADVTSIKGALPAYFLSKKRRFVSVHPMFGPTFANVNNLKGESCVLISESDKQGLFFFRKFFEDMGLSIFEYTFDEHDRMMAYSLTMPFVSTMVFAGCLDKKTVPGTTFAKHREIAEGLLSEDDQLLTEILFNESSMKQLERVTGRLEFLKHVIRAKDREEAKKFFKRLRKNLENGNDLF